MVFDELNEMKNLITWLYVLICFKQYILDMNLPGIWPLGRWVKLEEKIEFDHIELFNFDYFEYSRFSALFDSSASCSALLEHTRIANITAESHIEPIKTKTKNYKGFLRRWVSLLAKVVWVGVSMLESFYTGILACLGGGG